MTREELLIEIERFNKDGFKGSFRERMKWLYQLFRIMYWQRVHDIAAL